MKYMFLATHSLLRLVRSGCLSWDGVMRAAPDDRLALLNAFRTLKKGVKPTEGFQWVVIAMQRLLSKFLKASRLAKNICTNLETPLWWPMVSLLVRPSLSKGQQWSAPTRCSPIRLSGGHSFFRHNPSSTYSISRPSKIASATGGTCQRCFTFCCPQDIQANAHVASATVDSCNLFEASSFCGPAMRVRGCCYVQGGGGTDILVSDGGG